MVAPGDESGLLDEMGLARPRFHWRLESIRREHRTIPGQPGWLQAQRQAVGRDLGRVEKREAIFVRQARTNEQGEDLFVLGVHLEDEGGSG